MNPVLNAISSRRSHRVYEKTPLTKEQLDLLLKAALESPSARNMQPWHFSVVTNQELLNEMNKEVWVMMMQTDPAHRSERFEDSSFNVFYHAPTVIFISGHRDNGWASLDCGIAVENIALAAESLGLGSVILGLPKAAFKGSRTEEFRKALQIPDTHDFQIAIALGVPTDTKDAHKVTDGKITLVD